MLFILVYLSTYKMLKSVWCKYSLQFKLPAGTSRGVLQHKDTYFIKVWNDGNPLVYGIGESALFKGLSCDDKPDYEEKLDFYCKNINSISNFKIELVHWPSILFGIETALADLQHGGKRLVYPSLFAEGKTGIQINGLIWMGEKDFILQQVKEKLAKGFKCLKFKVGTHLEQELEILKMLRSEFTPTDLEIRIDANGAYTPENVIPILNQFATFHIHSIEQPIKQGNRHAMAEVCKQSPIPVALDEELIGITGTEMKIDLLKEIQPTYIILKPSLMESFSGTSEWISLAQEHNIGWWITSALESNIGLNAIAQFTATLNPVMPQGLGTGALYVNNITSPLEVKGQYLFYNREMYWDTSIIQF